MQKHDGLTNDTNPNATTIEILSRMAEYYERIQDHWRLMAYRKAISALRKQPAKITNRAAALAIPHIGERLATKIEEIVNTKTLRRLKYANSDSNSTALELFLGIYGVGHSTAQSFLAAGHRTLADIENLPLTKNQRIGLEHHADFNTRIPRSEVTDHAAFVKSHLARISPTVELTVGGSYRRGAETSGDVDFLLWAAGMPLPVLRFIFLDKLIHALVEAGYIQCALTMADHGTGTKWHGAATLPSPTKTTNPWRRVDFLLVPWEERGAALIYFTGNDTFNSSMRLLASRKGMRLNRRGLYRDVMRGPSRAKITDGTLVEQESERRIFEILGVPWRPPEHRNC
jgi:DNA polymerase IV